LAALALGCGQIESGRADRVLVIGAEMLTRMLDPDDRKTAALFGDGAGAVVLGPDGPGSVGPILLGANGSLGRTITASHEDLVIRMDGYSTFQVAVEQLAQSTRAAVADVGLTLADIDLFVYHQANGRILRAVAERLHLAPDRVLDYIGELGNTSAASIPLALAHARADRRLQAGQRLLVAAIGAGFTWGAGVIDWGLAS
jgi:3-oxoacyl-[acyl-carrier-protein] synthase-3